MKRGPARLAALIALCVVLLTFATLRPAHAGQSDEAAMNRQILVMLRLPAAHFRPNSSYSGDYGDAAPRAARRKAVAGLARRGGLVLVDAWPMPLLGVDCYVLQVPEGKSFDQALEWLSHDSMVLWAQPMHVYRTQGEPGGEPQSDPLYAVQPAAAWQLTELHRYATGRGVTVAVIDSKVEVGHPDLSGQFVANQDFVIGHPNGSEQHGTGIAGVIGAKAGNGLGIAGVAPGARLMALRACWQGPAAGAQAVCGTLSLAKALHFAIDHGVQVINLSLSGPPDPLLDSLISIALSHRISVVAAYDDALPQGGFPASKPGVVAVDDESLPSHAFTVYGAPGRDVPTTQPGGKWYVVNGSSYAAAHVSGLLALVLEKHRSGTPRLVVDRAPGNPVDACATLMRTTPDCDCGCAMGRLDAAARRR